MIKQTTFPKEVCKVYQKLRVKRLGEKYAWELWGKMNKTKKKKYINFKEYCIKEFGFRPWWW
jgi:hypothetical protein